MSDQKLSQLTAVSSLAVTDSIYVVNPLSKKATVQNLLDLGSLQLIAESLSIGTVAEVPFLNLSAYSEILVIARNITTSAAQLRLFEVSINNGLGYLTTSGDYITVLAGGTESNNTAIAICEDTTTSARSGMMHVKGWNSTRPKMAFPLNRNISNGACAIIPTANALNAFRIRAASGNITGGNIYVYGRR